MQEVQRGELLGDPDGVRQAAQGAMDVQLPPQQDVQGQEEAARRECLHDGEHHEKGECEVRVRRG